MILQLKQSKQTNEFICHHDSKYYQSVPFKFTFVDGVFSKCEFSMSGPYTEEDWEVLSHVYATIQDLKKLLKKVS